MPEVNSPHFPAQWCSLIACRRVANALLNAAITATIAIARQVRFGGVGSTIRIIARSAPPQRVLVADLIAERIGGVVGRRAPSVGRERELSGIVASGRGSARHRRSPR